MEVGSSSSNFKLYDQFELLEFEDRLVFKSLESPDKGFSICRHESSSGKPSKTSTIYGVAGTIRLLAGTYVLVITSRKEVGSFLGFPVYRVESMKFLACNEALRFSNSQEKRDEAYFMSLLKTVEATPGLYYSYETDITLAEKMQINGSVDEQTIMETGTRMWRRGANLEGDTANFIETEQLLELEGFRCSSLQ
ncbi:hypothetical protein Golax_002468, partial [Gossypium laxum]|nr:hypothetical protein [Gossypium laxum]